MNSRRMSPLRQLTTQLQLGLAGLFVLVPVLTPSVNAAYAFVGTPNNGSISIL
jgi:hypothetical protein